MLTLFSQGQVVHTGFHMMSHTESFFPRRQEFFPIELGSSYEKVSTFGHHLLFTSPYTAGHMSSVSNTPSLSESLSQVIRTTIRLCAVFPFSSVTVRVTVYTHGF